MDSGFSLPYKNFIIPIVLVLAYLMVSKIKYDTFPKFTLKGIKEKPFRFIFIVAAVVILAITKGEALFYIFVFIILFGIFRHIYYFIAKKQSN